MWNHKLILTGFMGTGKTTVAQLIGEKTGLPVIDLDALIVERTGWSIPQIFERFGEVGFRAWERAICAEVGAMDDPCIVSTGGGALLTAANRRALSHKGTIICLTARPEVIDERVRHGKRPLLQSANPLERIQSLLEQRQVEYAQFRWQVDTSDISPEAVSEQVLGLWKKDEALRQGEMRVETPEGDYPIYTRAGGLSQLGDLLDLHQMHGRRVVVVSDTNVAPLYGETVVHALPNAQLVMLPAGEAYKNLTTVQGLYDSFVTYGLDRHGVVVALGGGVIGDTVGYAAATYMRGVQFVQIPTTLLAMVDSSVGGKVGVDIPSGKNLVGAFKQPDFVLIDPDVLLTLPMEEKRAGMAEVVKHGLIARPALLEPIPLEQLLREAVQVKIDVVQRDPYERGERAHLNLGHTFGHAIEAVSGYTWRHGDAVAVGLVGAAMLSHRLGFIARDIVQMIEAHLREIGLPIRYRDLESEALWKAMQTDKKWRNGRSHFVILRDIARPDVIQDVPKTVVMEIWEALRES